MHTSTDIQEPVNTRNLHADMKTYIHTQGRALTQNVSTLHQAAALWVAYFIDTYVLTNMHVSTNTCIHTHERSLTQTAA